MSDVAALSEAEQLLAEVESRPRRFAPYGDSRSTAIPSIESLPAHWHTKPLKHVARLNPDDLPDSTDADFVLDYVDISNVDYVKGIVGTEAYRFEDAPSRARRRVQRGDTIISTVRTYLKAIAHIGNAPENLIASTGFAVLRPSDAIDSRFLYRVVQSEGFVGRVVANSVGVSYPAIAPRVLGRFEIPLPPIDEQGAIARFLDRETAKIDSLVAKKRRLIELLAEKRTALISHTVTKGLNPDAPMRPSGIDWLGDVPEHWNVRLLKRVAAISYGVGGEIDRSLTEGLKTISLPNIDIQGRLNLDDVPVADIPDHEKAAILLQKGDLLFNWRNGSADHLGKTAYFDADGEYSHVSFLLKLRFPPAVSSRYFQRLLNGYQITGFFRSSKAGVNNTFNLSELSALPVPCPPHDEQVKIENFLEVRIQSSDRLSMRIACAIERLNEYRSSLISAAVTGQIDVRKEVADAH